MYPINIGNLHKGAKGEYIGRGSPLGNPYPITHINDRDYVCDAYEEYLDNEITKKNPVIIKELDRLRNIHNQRQLTLVCFCHPKRCHGLTIRNYLLKGTI